MLQAGCIYLGLISPAQKPSILYICQGLTPCPGDLPPPAQNLPPPVQLQMPFQLKNTQNIPPNVSLKVSTNLPLNMKPPWSLSHQMVF